MVAGTVLNSLLGLAFYVLAARSVSVSEFGQFMFVLACGLIVAEIGDFGFTNALIKFGQKENFPKVFTAVFGQRIILTVMILPFVIIWPGQAAIALSLLFFSLGYQSLIARQKYSLYIFDNIVGNILRLGLLLLVGPVLAFIFANFLAFILALIFLKINLNFSNFKKQFTEIAKFSGWLGGSFSLASLASKIDVPVLYAFTGPVAVGIYSSAQKLASIVPQVAGAVESVFAPKLAKGQSVFKDYFLIALFVGFGLMIASFLSPWLILPFGPKYAQSAPVLAIFLLGFIPFFLSGPFAASILYKFAKSRWHFFVNFGGLITSVALYFLLIPVFKEYGAAITIVCTNSVTFLLYFLLWRYQTNKSVKN